MVECGNPLKVLKPRVEMPSDRMLKAGGLSQSARVAGHASVWKPLPGNCTCVNTLNADFVLHKPDVDNAMTAVHLKRV